MSRRHAFYYSEGSSIGWHRRNIKQVRLRHAIKHPPHQSVKRAEVDQGATDVDEVPASSCLARVPTYSKATQLSVQHAFAVVLKCMNSSFPLQSAKSGKSGNDAKVCTHTSKLAKPLNAQWCS